MKLKASSLKKCIYKPLAKLTKGKRRYILPIWGIKEDILPTNPENVGSIIREYYKQLYTHKFSSLDAKHQFFGGQNYQK